MGKDIHSSKTHSNKEIHSLGKDTNKISSLSLSLAVFHLSMDRDNYLSMTHSSTEIHQVDMYTNKSPFQDKYPESP